MASIKIACTIRNKVGAPTGTDVTLTDHNGNVTTTFVPAILQQPLFAYLKDVLPEDKTTVIELARNFSFLVEDMMMPLTSWFEKYLRNNGYAVVVV